MFLIKKYMAKIKFALIGGECSSKAEGSAGGGAFWSCKSYL